MADRVDLLLTAVSTSSPLRIGDIGKNAPYVIMFCEGDKAILPFPVNITTGNQILWEQKDFTAGSALGAAVLSRGSNISKESIESLAARGTDVGKNLPTIGMAGLASTLGGMAGITDADDLYYHSQGKAVNPNKEMTFNGVGYRSFTFVFELIPLSEAEADEVGRFIKFFQQKAMPDYADGGGKTYFKYPEAWNIAFANAGQWIPRIMPCYLTDYQIDYGGAGKMALHTEDGAPVQTNITLTFTESELHMRDKVNQGFVG